MSTPYLPPAQRQAELTSSITALKDLRTKHGVGPTPGTSNTRKRLEGFIAGEAVPKFIASGDFVALVELASSDITELEAKESKSATPPPLPASATKPAAIAPPSAMKPPAPAAAAPVWDLAARTAEAERLMALPRDAAEIASINAKAVELTPAGEAQRQRLQDMTAAFQGGQSMNFFYRFKAGFDACRTYGPHRASALPAPSVHKDAMTADQLLALPSAAQARMDDEACRLESGRDARIEIKRAHAAASPGQKLAMQGVFGKALNAHKAESI